MAITQDSNCKVTNQSFNGYENERMHRVTCDFCGHVDEATRGRGSDGAAEAARKAGWVTVYPRLEAPAKWKCPACQAKAS